LRALARAANQSAGGDEPLALEGQDDLNEDTSDDDSSEGMRVHFEVAKPKPPAHVGNRLSFENDDLTVVHGDHSDPAHHSPRPEVLDLIEHQRNEESVLLQFLDSARALTEKGDYLQAIQAYTDALDVRLSHPEAYIGRGRCQMELGDYTSAMSDFRRAEDLQPGHPDPQAAMGDLYFARKEYKRAIEFYDQAVELDGAHAMARCRRGISHYYRKNYRQAFQDLQRANTLDPEIPNIKKYVQMALKKMERGE
jgi:tetratricopeptide (TPR) repeat protein